MMDNIIAYSFMFVLHHFAKNVFGQREGSLRR